ncbi:hypothetical protein FA10DRAFT_304864 [Acaromyces ingoldii]|uniref:Uncharacterized protein n=1 Tax=Acaromyces ingoldii TaxID=215250 RepID=A0A316YA26_9BASI|nr:hypothetical protein FA10DRAFT_304864 [Acaromyces ingoldii]PWN86546.1 hypothetical protein FA10DRAFT_304864 [Acaromyces ingoldii]
MTAPVPPRPALGPSLGFEAVPVPVLVPVPAPSTPRCSSPSSSRAQDGESGGDEEEIGHITGTSQAAPRAESDRSTTYSSTPTSTVYSSGHSSPRSSSPAPPRPRPSSDMYTGGGAVRLSVLLREAIVPRIERLETEHQQARSEAQRYKELYTAAAAATIASKVPARRAIDGRISRRQSRRTLHDTSDDAGDEGKHSPPSKIAGAPMRANGAPSRIPVAVRAPKRAGVAPAPGHSAFQRRTG